uniref:SNTX MACPF/CDC-like domain-containing protein n=1 Tax=Panagrolaimus davidi TaxID=227884 RepID=A0A914QZ30_9BILA
MSIDECTRASLGRTATIGALYDVRTESLMLSNIFNNKIDEFIETRFDESSAGLKYDSFSSTKTSEILRKVGIDADASLSLLCGIVSASGSVEFVKDKTQSDRAVQLNILVSKTTKKEQINYKQPKLKEFFEFSGHEYATHVVVGITYGANATITFTDTNRHGHDKNKVEGKMSLELKELEKICPKLGNFSANGMTFLTAVNLKAFREFILKF